MPKKGPAAIKARGAIPATKVAAKQGGAGANSSGGTTAGSATGAGKAAGSGGGGGGGGGFTKSEMLAARKARKANAEAAAAAAAAKAGETTVPAAAATAAKSGAVASREGASAAESSGAGARVKGKWGFGAKLLAGTSVGVAALGIAWQLKPDEVRRLLDDSPIDHFAVWVMGKYALVSDQKSSCPVGGVSGRLLLSGTLLYWQLLWLRVGGFFTRNMRIHLLIVPSAILGLVATACVIGIDICSSNISTGQLGALWCIASLRFVFLSAHP